VLLLAFDTSTPAVTVALRDGTGVVASATEVAGHQHGELLAATIDRLLREAGAAAEQLSCVAVGTGPGPYTGLRAGLVTGRVLASALGIRADGICSLDVIAAAAAPQARGREFLVATDARRREVYWARYSAAGQRLDGPSVGFPAELPAGLPAAGEGAERYPELAAEVIGQPYPEAAVLAQLAAVRAAADEPAVPLEPLYLRRPDAREPGKPKRVTA